MKTRHQCAPDGEWAMCVACDGRIHESGCATLKHPNKKVDCCPQRHKMLHDQGQTRGLFDDSLVMWHEDHPWGCHYRELGLEN